MELLVTKAFALYDELMRLYPTENDPLQISTRISQLEPEIKKIAEYQTCVAMMNADATIRPLLGKTVGTIAGSAPTDSANTCVMRFIERMHYTLEGKTFDSALFTKHYEAFEELFYTDRLRFRDTVRLHNFESANEIVLEDGLAIIRLPLIQEGRTRMEEMRHRPHVQFTRSNFGIERIYTKPKLVGISTIEPPPEQVARELNESGDMFDLVIKALRILKPSAVFRDRSITTEALTFMPYAGVQTRAPFGEYIVMGDKCVVSPKDATALKTLYTKMKQTKQQPFTIASNRLGFGMERRSDEDRLLDYMIGLESLYLPDGNAELTFKLSLRVAFVTRQEMADRKHMFEFMKKLYDVRSRIAHGKGFDLTKEDISQIEEVLRQSLKIYLDKPANFSKDALNNIYFDG